MEPPTYKIRFVCFSPVYLPYAYLIIRPARRTEKGRGTFLSPNRRQCPGSHHLQERLGRGCPWGRAPASSTPWLPRGLDGEPAPQAQPALGALGLQQIQQIRSPTDVHGALSRSMYRTPAEHRNVPCGRAVGKRRGIIPLVVLRAGKDGCGHQGWWSREASLGRRHGAGRAHDRAQEVL